MNKETINYKTEKDSSGNIKEYDDFGVCRHIITVDDFEAWFDNFGNEIKVKYPDGTIKEYTMKENNLLEGNEKEIITTKRVFKVGGSIVIPIDTEIIKKKKIQNGDYITSRLNIENIIHVNDEMIDYLCRRCGHIFSFNKFQLEDIYCPVCDLEGKNNFTEKIEEQKND